MNRYSDSESHDSDEGIRFKTDSTRFKQGKSLSLSRRERSRSRSPQRRSRRDTKRHRSDDSSRRKHLYKRSSNTEESSRVGSAKKEETSEEKQTSDDSSSYGPQLPPRPPKKEETEGRPQSPKKQENSQIGPQLPLHLQKKEEPEEASVGPVKKQGTSIGPQLPPHLRQKLEEITPEESDEDVYGPVPVDSSKLSKAQIALEERALQLKMDQLEPSTDKVVREEWMVELPEVKKAGFSLGPRQFRSKPGPDMSDRSSWTDTPDKKEKPAKVDMKKEAEVKEIRKRDEEQEKISKKLKKKNKESLLEIHQSKMAEKKKDEGPSERRPFSRDIDLQVNRFDEAQKKAVLKKAQLLDDRFSSGQSKFL